MSEALPVVFYKSGHTQTKENLSFARFPGELIRAMDIKGIPAGLWKFTLVAFRKLMVPLPDGSHPYKFTFTHGMLVDEYGFRSEAVSDFVYWYEVSGFFKVTHGYRSKLKEAGVPTVMKYRTSATVEEWFIFLHALAETRKRFMKTGKAMNGRFYVSEESEEKTDARLAFQIALAFAVDKSRSERKLPPVNNDYLEWLIRRGDICREGDKVYWSTPGKSTFVTKQLVEV